VSKFKVWAISLIVVMVFVAPQLLEANEGAGTKGLIFLKIPNGTRETAMGETGVSHSMGGASSAWNPALAGEGVSSIEFQGFRWLFDGQGSFGGAKIRTSWGGLSAYYFQLGVDGFEARERPGGYSGTFTLRQVVVAVGGAYRLPANFTVGVTTKGYLEDIYGDREEGIGLFDAGLSWKSGDWSAGAMVANTGLTEDGEDPLPTLARGGLTYSKKFGEYGLVSSLEGSYMQKYDPTVHLGIEGNWSETLFIRAGLLSGNESYFYSCGLGVTYKGILADIAVTPASGEIGHILRVGLGYRL